MEEYDVNKTEYKECTLCQRNCHSDRILGKTGFCNMPSDAYIARIGLHKWEEPLISGEHGSGTVFFSGCSLGCIFCQNREISRNTAGRKMSCQEIAESMLMLEARGASNVNFVTPTHYAPTVIESVRIARDMGLKIPIVYNTASYEKTETVRALKSSVDVFLPDFKYYLEKTAEKYSNAKDYVKTAKLAIDEMVKLSPRPIIENGLMKSGVIVRILLLPGHVAEAKLSLEYLYKTYGDSIYISLMSQYTPMPDMPSPLDRRVTNREYRDLVFYAEKLGVKKAFTQDISSSSEEYIPEFLK
jgi:putative pyruvate formate lyase activating enzyme